MDGLAEPRARRNTIADAVRRCAAKWGRHPALQYGERSWSHRELEQASLRVARHLLDMGLRPGERVAAYGRNSDAYLLLWLGCAQAGIVHVPVNYGLTGRELAYVVTQSGAAALFHDPELAPMTAALDDVAAVRLRGVFEAEAGPDILSVALDAGRASDIDCAPADEDVAQIVYTSGTTSAPKGAMMTHRALLAEYYSCIHDLEYRQEDRVLFALPLYHSGQLHCFTMPQLLVGSATWLIRSPDPETVLTMIERHRITSFFAPPTVWISLLRHPDFRPDRVASLRTLYYGASIMPAAILQELRQRVPGVRVFNCYGQTEVGPLATVLRPADHDAHPNSAGRPILNMETRVVDAAMRDTAPGVPGEIVHRSPQLLVGYWDDPAATAEAFRDGWFKSGDMGYFDEDGFLYVVDRIKDVINTGGVLVAPREVEDVLFQHPAVSEVAVIGLPHPKWIEAVTAFVVLRAAASVDEAELMAHARGLLAHYKRPKRIILLDELPRNASGKLLKRELRRSHSGSAAAFVHDGAV